MQFKKGSFEVGGTIYPVAIKYDPIFGDAFWNSSQNGMASYIYLMMTSWAIGKLDTKKLDMLEEGMKSSFGITLIFVVAKVQLAYHNCCVQRKRFQTVNVNAI